MAKIVTLKDDLTNEVAYPQTKASAVYLDNGDTVQADLTELGQKLFLPNFEFAGILEKVYLRSNGNYGVLGDIYSLVIPVDGGQPIYIKGGAASSSIGFLKSYASDITDGSPADLCDPSAPTTAIAVGTEYNFTTPNDCKFIIILMVYSNASRSPELLSVNGNNIIPAVGPTYGDLYKNVVRYTMQEKSVSEKNVARSNIGAIGAEYVAAMKATLHDIELVELPFQPGYIDNNIAVVSESSFHYAKVACQEGEVYTINATTDRSAARFFRLLDSSENQITAGGSGPQSVDWMELIIPKGAAYLVINDNSGRMSYKGRIVKSTFDHIKEQFRQNDRFDNISDTQVDLLTQKLIKDNWAYYFQFPTPPTSYADAYYYEERIRAVPAGKKMLFLTDTHFRNDGDQLTSSKKSVYLADYIRRRVGASIVTFGGDCLNHEVAGANSRFLAAAKLTEFAAEFFAAFGKKGLWVQGNHDCNSAAAFYYEVPYADAVISDTEAYNRTVRNIEDQIVFDERGMENVRSAYAAISQDDMAEFMKWMQMHYYYDDNANKIRYIVLETCDNGHTLYQTIGRLSSWLTFQIDFLASALMSVPEGYDVIVHGHLIGELGENVGDPANITATAQVQMMSLLNCYRRRAAKNLSDNQFVPSGFPEMQAYWDAFGTGGHRYDLTTHKGSGRVIVICGHYHMDVVMAAQNSNSITEVNPATIPTTTFSDDVVFVVWRNRDAYGGRNARVDRTLYGVSPVMELDTVTENSFDVVTIQENTIHFTRFGANGSAGDLTLPY